MNKLKVNIFLLVIISLFFGGLVLANSIYAACGCPGSTEVCTNGYTCIGVVNNGNGCNPGSCQQVGCFNNVNCPTGTYCSGDICLPNAGGTPPPGGGGAYQFPTCDGGTVLKCGTPTLYVAGGGTLTNDGNLAKCMQRGSCGNDYFPSRHTVDKCIEPQGICIDNCGCCGPYDNYVPTTTQGGIYQFPLSCFVTPKCNDWDDILISSVQGPATTENRCYRTCNNCGSDDEEWFWVYNNTITCRTVNTTWSCQPTCTPTAPTAATLVSPSNGAILQTTPVTLTWSGAANQWGAACPSNANSYTLFIGANNPPTSGTGMGLATSYPNFAATPGVTYYWYVRRSNGSLTANSPVYSFTVSPAEPWWQAKDGDVTVTGNLSSEVPTSRYFSDVGLGGFPGIPTYSGSFNLSSTTTKVSTNGWNSNTVTSQPRLFNYEYFEKLIPEDVFSNDISNLASGGPSYSDGYEWYIVNGSLSIDSAINFGSRKVIVFVDGDLNINSTINLTDGQGFVGFFVNGNISASNSIPNVVGPEIEGIYLANSSFSSGTATSQLHLRGAIATFAGFALGRDLADDATAAAELFEYGPDQILLFPEKLSYRQTRWVEVAP